MLSIRRVFQTHKIIHAKYSALLFQGHYRDFCSDSEKKDLDLDLVKLKKEIKKDTLKSLKEHNDFVSRRDYNESQNKFENTISEVEEIKNTNQKFGIDINAMCNFILMKLPNYQTVEADFLALC